MEGKLMSEKQNNKKEYNSVILATLLHDIKWKNVEERKIV